MGLTPADRFTLIMFGLGVAVAVLAWLIKRVTAANDAALADNRVAIEKLTAAVNALTERVARYEGAPQTRRRRRWL